MADTNGTVFDIVVLGGGSGGYAAALRLAEQRLPGRAVVQRVHRLRGHLQMARIPGVQAHDAARPFDPPGFDGG